MFKMGNNHKAFTIVELLVVIVIIGILAAITIVSFSGISNKAISSNLLNDLDSDAKLLKMYNVEYGSYPTSIDASYCPVSPNTDTRYCLKAMNGATLDYISNGNGFTLIDTHTSTKISYKITENSSAVSYEAPSSFIASWAGSGDDTDGFVTQTSDGNYLIAGTTSSFGAGGTDAYLAKFAKDGTLIWNKTWGESGSDNLTSATKTSDGGIAITGYTNSFGIGAYSDGFIAKYLPNGTLEWSKTFGFQYSDYPDEIIQTQDGNYIVVGAADAAFVNKFGSDGSLTWSKMFKINSIDEAYSVTQINDGNYIVVGRTRISSTTQTFYAKYAPDGSLLFAKSYENGSEATSVTSESDGGFSLSSGNNIARFDTNGNLIWDKQYSGMSGINFIHKNNSDGYITGGQTSSSNTWDIYLMNLNNVGDILWTKVLDMAYLNYIDDARQTTNDEFIISSMSSAAAGYTQTAYITKTKSDGTIKNCSIYCKTITITVSDPSISINSRTPTTSNLASSITSRTAIETNPTNASALIISP